MSIRQTTANLAAAVIVMGMVPSFAATQSTVSCKEGEVAVASLGYSKLECNCIVGYIEGEPGRTLYEFRSEPRIWNITAGGPADGKLKEGDVVTAIDGYLITTAEGGNRFGDLATGEPVALTVRREGRELDVTIRPVAECKAVTDLVPPPAADMPPEPAQAWTVKTAPRVALLLRPDTPAEPAAPRAILPPPVPDYAILPRGWLGFSLTCSDCKVIKIENEVSL